MTLLRNDWRPENSNNSEEYEWEVIYNTIHGLNKVSVRIAGFQPKTILCTIWNSEGKSTRDFYSIASIDSHGTAPWNFVSISWIHTLKWIWVCGPSGSQNKSQEVKEKSIFPKRRRVQRILISCTRIQKVRPLGMMRPLGFQEETQESWNISISQERHYTHFSCVCRLLGM